MALEPAKLIERIDDDDQVNLAVLQRTLVIIAESGPDGDALGGAGIEEFEYERRREAATDRAEHAEPEVRDRDCERRPHRHPQSRRVEQQLLGAIE